jgi:hypothetical protein
MARLRRDVRRSVLEAASAEAARRGDRRIGTDHLLLSLLHNPEPDLAALLPISLDAARAADDQLDAAALNALGIDAGGLDLHETPEPPRRILPLTSGARETLKLAFDVARPRRVGRIDGRHLLLALLSRSRPDPGAELLHALGLDAERLRARLNAANAKAVP